MSTPIPVPLPVAFGPHEADWWMVAITLVAAIASVAVAISAFVTSSRAQRTANDSEAARVQAEIDREAWEYRLRYEDALISFMSDVGAYLDRLADARSVGGGKPSLDPLVASLEIVRLRARGTDRETMDGVRRIFSVAFKMRGTGRVRLLISKLLKKVREVTDGSIGQDEFEQWVQEVEAELTKQQSAAT